MSKKLIAIERNFDNDKVTFHFDDSSTLTLDIDGTEERTYLYNSEGNNSEAFFHLGIENPHALYKDIGVYLDDDGECPECRRKDLDKVFDYLLKHYSVEPVEPKEEQKKEPKQPSEWDWLLD